MYPNNDVSKQERESAEEVKRLERQLKEQRAGGGDKREFQKKQLVSHEAQLHSAQVLYVCPHATICVRIHSGVARGAAHTCSTRRSTYDIPLCVLIPLCICLRIPLCVCVRIRICVSACHYVYARVLLCVCLCRP